MSIFAILNNTNGAAGEIINIVVAPAPKNAGWLDITNADPKPAKGWEWDGTIFNPTESLSYKLSNEQLDIAGQPAQGLNNTFYATPGDTISYVADIVDSQNTIQTQIDQISLGYPPILKVPLVKMVGGVQGSVVNEVYLSTTLVNGVIAATGTIPESGDWKLVTDRVNKSLKAIGADWEIIRENINILV